MLRRMHFTCSSKLLELLPCRRLRKALHALHACSYTPYTPAVLAPPDSSKTYPAACACGSRPVTCRAIHALHACSYTPYTTAVLAVGQLLAELYMSISVSSRLQSSDRAATELQQNTHPAACAFTTPTLPHAPPPCVSCSACGRNRMQHACSKGSTHAA